MKKRTYTTPVIAEWSLADEELLAGSEMTSSEMGITFGGVDESGELDPLSRPLDIIRGELPL
jgi:hypothetical protein